MFNHPVDFPESLVLPFWLGDGAEHRREAELIGSYEVLNHYLVFAYTVRYGDTDTDGIYIGTDPLGDNAGVEFHSEGSAAFPAYLRLGANQLPVAQSVDGARSRVCQDVLCSTVIAEAVKVTTVGVAPAILTSYVPYAGLGEASAITFEYDGEDHAFRDLVHRPAYLEFSLLE